MTARMVMAAGMVVMAVVLSGCGLPSLSGKVLPGAVGAGDDGYTLTVQLEDVGNLVTNAEVKVADRTVGTVKRIQLDGWTASVTIGVLDSVELPSATEARIGQKSLLGAEYVELTLPTDDTGEVLRDGDTITLDRSGRYTDTEDLIATLALWLNGGGLEHIETIATEVNAALNGNGTEARNLITNVDRMMSGLDRHQEAITDAMTAVNELSARLRTQREVIGEAIEAFPAGLGELNRQRDDLVAALAALDDLSTIADDVVRTGAADLVEDLESLRPALREISKAADSLPEVLDIAGTILYPVQAVPYVIKGDFLSSAATVDLTLANTARGLVPDTPVEEAITVIRSVLSRREVLTSITDALNDATGGLTVGPSDDPHGSLPAPQDEPSVAPVDEPERGLSGFLRSLLGGLA